jgi:hypothetical protein
MFDLLHSFNWFALKAEVSAPGVRFGPSPKPLSINANLSRSHQITPNAIPSEKTARSTDSNPPPPDRGSVTRSNIPNQEAPPSPIAATTPDFPSTPDPRPSATSATDNRLTPANAAPSALPAFTALINAYAKVSNAEDKRIRRSQHDRRLSQHDQMHQLHREKLQFQKSVHRAHRRPDRGSVTRSNIPNQEASSSSIAATTREFPSTPDPRPSLDNREKIDRVGLQLWGTH